MNTRSAAGRDHMGWSAARRDQRNRTYRAVLGVLAGVSAAALIAGCGQAGSSGTKAEKGVSGAGCAPVAGDKLVVLTDDKHLQNSDNLVPAINAKVASKPLLTALNKVSAALDTTKLIELNKRVDVDRQPSQQVADDFAKSEGLNSGLPHGSGHITIGAADFSENKTLGYLYAEVLDEAGYDTTVRTIGNRELYEPALEKGQIQVVPEYAATLTEFLNQKANGKNATPQASGDIDTTMTALTKLGAKYGLKFGEPSAAADQNAFAVTKAFAAKHHVSSLSQFADKCSGKASVLGGPPECPQRPFCQPGLLNTYHIEFGQFKQLDAGGPRSKTALQQGTVTMALLFSSDASLAR